MTAVTQAQFARDIGVVRSHITALKQAGRIVLTADGLVDVEASRQRIIETADPNRDDVVRRWAAERGPTTIAPPEIPEEGDDEPATGTYASARARKEHAQADIAEMERDKQRGLLIERAAVAAAVEDIMTTVRQSFEQQPHRVAPMLIGLDLDAIRAILKQETNGVLAEMVKEFGKRLRQIAGEEEGAA